jgi:hypothetical protein
MMRGLWPSDWQSEMVSSLQLWEMVTENIADPTKQSDFSDQVVANTTDIDPGHQCYKIHSLENIAAGQNATIQLEYWAEFEGENNGKNQSFFACADIVRTSQRARTQVY